MMSQSRCVVSKIVTILLFLPLNPFVLSSQTPVRASLDSANATITANWKTTKHGNQTTRVNPDANLSLYNAITVGTVAYTGPAKKLKPQESGKLVSLLHDSLAKDLSVAKLSSDAVASGALTLNANITHVKRSHPWVNVLTIAGVFVPLDLGDANVTAWIVDQKTGQAVAEIETRGCGQIYQVLPSLQTFGQSRLMLKKGSRLIAKEVKRMDWNPQFSNLDASAMSTNQ